MIWSLLYIFSYLFLKNIKLSNDSTWSIFLESGVGERRRERENEKRVGGIKGAPSPSAYEK